MNQKWKKKCKKKKCAGCAECASVFEQPAAGAEQGDDGDVDDEPDDVPTTTPPSAEDVVGEDGLLVCDRADLDDAFLQMGDACKKDLLNAIAASSPLTFDRRCQCFLKVDVTVASDLTCKSQVWKGLTVAQEFGQCVAAADPSAQDVCEKEEIDAVMSQMDESCHSALNSALMTSKTLDNSTRCECFMEINPTVAKTVKCKINDMQQFTLAEEYAQCVAAAPTTVAAPQVCTEEQLLAPFAQMDDACTSMLADAIANDTPLTQEDRCACYEQVDDEVGLALGCMTMPAKKMTLAQEYQMCMTSGMGITCTAAELFGTSGLAAMSDACKTQWQAAIEDPDDPLDSAANCGCFGNVGAENALGLRCKMMKGAPGTVASQYQGCMAAVSELTVAA